jgi:hypothetical protein
VTAARHPFAVELRALLAIAVPLGAANVAQMYICPDRMRRERRDCREDAATNDDEREMKAAAEPS